MISIRRLLNLLGLLGLVALLLWVLWESSTIFLYFIVSSVVALIGRPLFNLMEKAQVRGRRLPRALAAMFTLVALMSIFAGTIAIFVPMLMREAQVLYNINYSEVKESLLPAIRKANEQLVNFGIREADSEVEGTILQYIYEGIDFRSIPTVLNNIFGIFGNIAIAIFSVAFMTFFLLRDQHLVPNLIIGITPRSREGSAKRIIDNTRRTLSRYFLGLVIQVTAITLCIWIGLSIIGVKNALLIAFFTGLANLIPYVGPWIGATFGIFIMVSNSLGLGFHEVILPKFYGMLVVFASTQLLDNYVFQPVIFSNSINAHPLEIFIVILVAGTLGGILGMVAAIPVYAFIRIVAIELNKEFGILERIKGPPTPEG